MNGRFPLDIFTIMVVPFAAITAAILAYVHYDLAMVAALVLTIGLALGALIFWMRRRNRRNT